MACKTNAGMVRHRVSGAAFQTAGGWDHSGWLGTARGRSGQRLVRDHVALLPVLWVLLQSTRLSPVAPRGPNQRGVFLGCFLANATIPSC